MNCGRFNLCLCDYIDGTLSVGQRAAAEEHLSDCRECREALRQEQELTRFLSHELQQDTERLTLGVEVRRRVAAVLADGARENVYARGPFLAGLRFAWPSAIAAAVLVMAILAGGFFFRSRKPEAAPEIAKSQPVELPQPVSIRLSYGAPVYIFRKEGNSVVDVLSYATNAVDGTIWVNN